ncbi:MAG: ATP-binding cassette domain-containing protein [Muricoprocola sp.]
MKNVRKSYNGKVIFENVDLKLEDGTVTAFVGHNGCGKSTMLKVISGLTRKDGGEIIYDKNYRIPVNDGIV